MLRLHDNPLAPWIWLGAAIMALGGGLSLSRPADARGGAGAEGRARRPGARGRERGRSAAGRRPDPSRRRALLLLPPLAAGGAAGLGFYAMLRGMGTGAYNPRGVPSALLGKPPPDFALPPLEGAGLPGLAAADLRAPGRPVLVNFFACWCVPCVIEHPQLMRLAREGVPVLGIAYKDKPADACASSHRHGNPFAAARRGRAGPGGDRLGPLRRAGDLPGGRGGHHPLALGRAGHAETRCAPDLGPLLRRHA